MYVKLIKLARFRRSKKMTIRIQSGGSEWWYLDNA